MLKPLQISMLFIMLVLFGGCSTITQEIILNIAPRVVGGIKKQSAVPIDTTMASTESLTRFDRLEIVLTMEDQSGYDDKDKIVDKIMLESIKRIINLKRFDAIGLSEEIRAMEPTKRLARRQRMEFKKDMNFVRKSTVLSSELGKVETPDIAVLEIKFAKLRKEAKTLAPDPIEVELELTVIERSTGKKIMAATVTNKETEPYYIKISLSKAIENFVKENFKERENK